MSGGLTSEGFVAETVEEIQTDINTSLLSTVDAALDLSADQPMGQIVGIFSEKIAELWELMATVYNQMDPDSAEGNLLDGLCALTGSRRQAATFSTAACTLSLNANTTVPAGSTISVVGQPQNTWTLQTAVTSTSSGSYTGNFISSSTGPNAANAGTLTVISTPVVGWTAVTNSADAELGLAEDTDTVLRNKRQSELEAGGSGTVDAIRSKLLEVEGVVSAFVFQNTTMETDANGVPPKSIHAIIWNGTTPEIDLYTPVAEVLWANKPAGISYFGDTVVEIQDSAGNTQSVYFDFATEVPIYITLTTSLGPTANTAGSPPGYITAVKLALTTFASTNYVLGQDVYALATKAVPLSVTGVIDVPTFFIGTAPSPSGTVNVPITGLQIATLSSTNILVDGT